MKHSIVVAAIVAFASIFARKQTTHKGKRQRSREQSWILIVCSQ